MPILWLGLLLLLLRKFFWVVSGIKITENFSVVFLIPDQTAWKMSLVWHLRIKDLAGGDVLIPKDLHSVKSVGIRSYSGSHFSHVLPHSDWIWRNMEYLSVFSPNAGKCGKMGTRITPDTDSFWTELVIRKFKEYMKQYAN